MWWWGGGGWRGFAVDCVRLHQLYASTVRIVEVHLTLAVDASADFQRLSVRSACGPGLEFGDSLVHVRNKEADVML